jgi:hypothetical protein
MDKKESHLLYMIMQLKIHLPFLIVHMNSDAGYIVDIFTNSLPHKSFKVDSSILIYLYIIRF